MPFLFFQFFVTAQIFDTTFLPILSAFFPLMTDWSHVGGLETPPLSILSVCRLSFSSEVDQEENGGFLVLDVTSS